MPLFAQVVDDDYGLGFVFLFILSVGMYFLPTFASRNKPQFNSVAILNFLLGWTLAGWVIALAWALEDAPRLNKIAQPNALAPLPAPILCHSCGKYSERGSVRCTTCADILPSEASRIDL